MDTPYTVYMFEGENYQEKKKVGSELLFDILLRQKCKTNECTELIPNFSLLNILRVKGCY